MNDAQLDRLTKLVHLTETCAKMGGTPMLADVQGLVATDLKNFLEEFHPEVKARKDAQERLQAESAAKLEAQRAEDEASLQRKIEGDRRAAQLENAKTIGETQAIGRTIPAQPDPSRTAKIADSNLDHVDRRL